MKIALMCGSSLDEFQQQVLLPILEDCAIEVSTALIDCRPKPSAKKRFLKNLKRGRGGYMLIMLVKNRLAQRKPSADTEEFLSQYNIPYIKTAQPYADDTLRNLRTLRFDTMVMLGGFGIVKEPLLSLAPQGILSYHHGNMRKYRGQPVGFWELYNGELEMGVTVQRLSAGLDRGTPIAEMTIPIERDDRVSTLRNRALASSTGMMHKALLTIEQDGFKPETIDTYGSVYTLPNLRQYIILQIKLLFR